MTTTTSESAGAASDWSRTAREVGELLAPGAADRDRTGQISASDFDRIRNAGLTAALVPIELGGGGASHAEMGNIIRQLGRLDSSAAVTLSMHAHVVATLVWQHRHGRDTSGILRRVAEERLVLVNSGASDWVGAGGSAERIEGGFRVRARKQPVSGCEVGDLLVTAIRRQTDSEPPLVIHCVIPLGADGVVIDRTWDTLGLRATGSHTVVLDDVFVPDSAVSLIRAADRWHPLWNTVLGSAVPLIMSAYLGIAERATELATDRAKDGDGSYLHGPVGEMFTSLITAADVVDGMFREADDLRFDADDAHASRALARKTVAAESVIRTVRLALEVAGGAGYHRACELERLYRDVHGCLFHPLPRAKQSVFTGRVALGLAPID